MEKYGAGGLILVAVVMLAIGVVLRWDLIDWMIDIVGFLFIVGGLVTGVVGILKLFLGGGRREATTY